MKLSEAVARSGWTLVVDSAPESHPDGLGSTIPKAFARALSGERVACLADSWDYAYAVSHEMAERDYGFKHSADTFAFQANILARWLRAVT